MKERKQQKFLSCFYLTSFFFLGKKNKQTNEKLNKKKQREPPAGVEEGREGAEVISSISPCDCDVARPPVSCRLLLFECWGGLHVSVADVLPVHQHIVPAQRPHLAPACHYMDLQLGASVPIYLGRRDSVDAVP